MATERVTERTTGGDTTVIETDRGGGSNSAGWLIALAVIAFLAIGAFFLMNATRNDNLQTAAVTDAASSVAGSVDQAADSVAGAADTAKDAATPAE